MWIFKLNLSNLFQDFPKNILDTGNFINVTLRYNVHHFIIFYKTFGAPTWVYFSFGDFNWPKALGATPLGWRHFGSYEQQNIKSHFFSWYQQQCIVNRSPVYIQIAEFLTKTNIKFHGLHFDQRLIGQAVGICCQ